jgi:hypothetical protein
VVRDVAEQGERKLELRSQDRLGPRGLGHRGDAAEGEPRISAFVLKRGPSTWP